MSWVNTEILAFTLFSVLLLLVKRYSKQFNETTGDELNGNL